MELKSLYTLKKIIETGSYQKAAIALNYAQSTITFQVKQLENELGIKLFEKMGNKMVLTEAANSIMPLIDTIILSADQLLNTKNRAGEIKGALKIALPESLVTYKLQNQLKVFKEKAPDVALSLQVMNCFDIQEQLIKGTVNLAIHYDVGDYPKNIKTKAIGKYPLILVGSPALTAEEKDFISPEQKKSICHIINDTKALTLKIFNRYLKEKNIHLSTEMEVWSIETIKRCVESNLGVAYLQRFTVEKELAAKTLIEIPTGIQEKNLTAIYAYHKNKWISPAMELLMEILDTY